MKKIQTILLVAFIACGISVAASPAVFGLECAILPDNICNAADEGQLQNSGIWRLLLLAINILTAGVGIVAVFAIAFAGFLYTTARDDQAQTKKAIEMIRNTAIGLVVYAFMFAGVNFLIPGGIFTTGASSPPPTSGCNPDRTGQACD